MKKRSYTPAACNARARRAFADARHFLDNARDWKRIASKESTADMLAFNVARVTHWTVIARSYNRAGLYQRRDAARARRLAREG